MNGWMKWVINFFTLHYIRNGLLGGHNVKPDHCTFTFVAKVDAFIKSDLHYKYIVLFICHNVINCLKAQTAVTWQTWD